MDSARLIVIEVLNWAPRVTERARHMAQDTTESIDTSTAEVYEAFFVPALFSQWPEQILKRASPAPDHYVLDVACGTGVLARSAAETVQQPGQVHAVDLNPGMLSVAKTIAPDIHWQLGSAEQLPYKDQQFDLVACQFGLMFFADRIAAIQEMLRVCKPSGVIAIAVWDSLDSSPGYQAVADLLAKLFGAEIAEEIRAPFCLGDTELLRNIVTQATDRAMAIETVSGSARFRSIEDWMYTDVRGWTLSNLLNDAQYQQLVNTANEELAHLVLADGSVTFEAPAHIVTLR